MDTERSVTSAIASGEASALAPATGSSAVNVGEGERLLSTIGGVALTIAGLRNAGSASGVGMLLGGGILLLRGVSGYCFVNQALGRNTARKSAAPVDIRTNVELNRPAAEVYTFWRRLENLPRIMRHLEKVEQIDQNRSRWTARGPGGIGALTWEAEIVEDQENQFISWRSLPGSTVDNAGQVRFVETPTGTDVRIQMTYRVPAGDLGGVAARLFSPMTEKMIREDIQDLKGVLESPTHDSRRTR